MKIIKEMLDNYTSQEKEKWVREMKKGIEENKSKWAREGVWKEAYRAGWNNASDEIIKHITKIIDIEEFENPERIKEMLDTYTSQEREKVYEEVKTLLRDAEAELPAGNNNDYQDGVYATISRLENDLHLLQKQ